VHRGDSHDDGTGGPKTRHHRGIPVGNEILQRGRAVGARQSLDLNVRFDEQGDTTKQLAMPPLILLVLIKRAGCREGPRLIEQDKGIELRPGFGFVEIGADQCFARQRTLTDALRRLSGGEPVCIQ